MLDSVGLAGSSGEGQGDFFQKTKSRKNRTEIHDGKRGPHRGGIGKIHLAVQPLEVLAHPGLVVIGSILANPHSPRTVTPGIKSRDMGNPVYLDEGRSPTVARSPHSLQRGYSFLPGTLEEDLNEVIVDLAHNVGALAQFAVIAGTPFSPHPGSAIAPANERDD